MLELSNWLLAKYGGLAGLVRADFRELCAEHGIGGAKSAQVKAALEMGRRLALLLCHNHPSGDPTPSPEDIQTTRWLVEANRVMDIELVDPLIIGQQRFVSLKELLKWE